jgi:hypothetical protein
MRQVGERSRRHPSRHPFLGRAGAKRVHTYPPDPPRPVDAASSRSEDGATLWPGGVHYFTMAMHRTQEVAGSSPASSIKKSPPNCLGPVV